VERGRIQLVGAFVSYTESPTPSLMVVGRGEEGKGGVWTRRIVLGLKRKRGATEAGEGTTHNSVYLRLKAHIVGTVRGGKGRVLEKGLADSVKKKYARLYEEWSKKGKT